MKSRLFDIIKSEYKHFFKDAGAMLIMIIGVFAYSFFYAVPYSSEVVKEVPISVVDLDRTDLSREFIKNLNISDYAQIKSYSSDIIEAEKEFFADKIKAFVVIPKNFEKEVLRGTQSTVSVFADTSYLIIYKAVYTGVMEVALDMGAKIEVDKLMKSGVPKQVAKAMKQPFEFIQVPMYNAAGGYETYAYPIILILVLHQTLLVGLGMLQGTRNELRDDYCNNLKEIPFTLFGKSTAYVLLYLFYSIIIFLIFPAVFVYPMSYNLIPLFIILVLMYYSIAFFSHMISYFFKTRESALMILVVTSLIFIFLPGLIWPKEAIPQWLNLVALFVPATCSVDGIIKINQMNATLWDIKWDVLWLIFLCITYFKLASFTIKKSCEKEN